MDASEQRSERFSAVTVAEAARQAAATRRNPGDTLTSVIEMATGLGSYDAASVTLLGKDRSLTTVASSDELITRADALQYELHQGPCLDAVWTDGLFVVKDLVADGRWPQWAPRAAELGVGAILAVHLFTDVALGALNLYSMKPRDFDHNDIEAARVIAAHASVVLAYARSEQNLWNAIDSRNLIGQAQGMLMERFGLSPERAFAVLRRHSQDHNRKLSVIADELVRTGKLYGLDDDGVEPGGKAVPEAAG